MAKAPRGFREGKFQYHEEVEVVIDNLTNLGQGVGRVDGWVIMVPFALPGERVRVSIYRNHANYSDADLVGYCRRHRTGWNRFARCLETVAVASTRT